MGFPSFDGYILIKMTEIIHIYILTNFLINYI